MVALCARLSSLKKPDLPSERWLHAVSYVPWHIQRAPGGHQAPSACWIHYIHKLIGGLSVFGLAVQHLLPAMFTEAMCQFIVGSPHTSALQHPRCDALCEWCSAEGVICHFFSAQHLLRVKICKSHQWSVWKYKLPLWIRWSEAKLIADVGVHKLC